MARPSLNVDVETGEVQIAGVWYSVHDTNQLIDNLIEILEARGWRTE